MKLKTSIFFVAFCIILSGCASVTQKSTALAIPGEIHYKDVKDVYSVIGSIPEKSKSYNSLADLINESHAIIEGTAQDITYFEKGNSTYSKLTVKVKYAYYGGLKPEDIVTVIEPGGYVPLPILIKRYGKERFTDVSDEEASKKYVKVTFGGSDVSNVGEKMLLFLWQDKENTWELSNDYFYIIGYNEGKFYFEGNSVERKIKDSSLEPFKMTKSDYRSKIIDIVKNMKK
jgi:hypothetical protein